MVELHKDVFQSFSVIVHMGLALVQNQISMNHYPPTLSLATTSYPAPVLTTSVGFTVSETVLDAQMSFSQSLQNVTTIPVLQRIYPATNVLEM